MNFPNFDCGSSHSEMSTISRFSALSSTSTLRLSNNLLISSTNLTAFEYSKGNASIQLMSEKNNSSFLLNEELSILYGIICFPSLNATATSFAVNIDLFELDYEINKVILLSLIASTMVT